ncbi:MAG TPA: hypothetical protein VF204_16320 [Streptosporangiaceae bacterium]
MSPPKRVFNLRPAITAGLALVVVSSAWALGAWAIAYLVVRRARVGKLWVGELEIGQLTVGRLDVREDSHTEPGKAATTRA